jgi:hypothetical protein
LEGQEKMRRVSNRIKFSSPNGNIIKIAWVAWDGMEFNGKALISRCGLVGVVRSVEELLSSFLWTLETE